MADGAKKRAMIHERDAQEAQAKENLARISDVVEVKVPTTSSSGQNKWSLYRRNCSRPARKPGAFSAGAGTGHTSAVSNRGGG